MRCLRINLAMTMLWLLAASSAAVAAVDDFDDGAIYQVHYPAWFKDSFLNLGEDADEAREAGKQGLFVFFTTQGCSYCHLFIETSLAILKSATVCVRISTALGWRSSPMRN